MGDIFTRVLDDEDTGAAPLKDKPILGGESGSALVPAGFQKIGFGERIVSTSESSGPTPPSAPQASVVVPNNLFVDPKKKRYGFGEKTVSVAKDGGA